MSALSLLDMADWGSAVQGSGTGKRSIVIKRHRMNRADRRKTAKTNKERIGDYILAGRQLMAPGNDNREAQRFFKQVLSIEPHNGEANLYLGILEMWIRNLPKANEYFQKAYRADPNNPAVLNNLAISIHEQGGIPEAVAIYRKVLEIEEDNVEGRVNLARGLMQMAKPDEAIVEAKRAVEVNPEFGTGQFVLGSIAQTLGDSEVAVKALTEAIKLMPGHMEAHFRLCREIYDADNPDAQLEPAREIFMANRNSADAALCYSELLYGMERHDEAIANLLPHAETESLRMRLNVVNGLANIHADKGLYEEAVKFHKEALAIASDDPHTRYFYGRTLNMMGDYKTAAAQLQKSMPALQMSQEAVAQSTLAQKKSGDAKPFSEEVLKLVVELDLGPSGGYDTIADLNQDVIKALSNKEQTLVHPLDFRRRFGKKSWESSLASDNGEAIVALAENLHDKLTLYIADMPEGFDNHPMVGRKKFGIGQTRSWTESIKESDGTSVSIDQIGWFKGVYFLTAPEECADEEKKSGWLRIGVPHFSTADKIAPDLEIKPQAGKLVLFPAYYWHGFNTLKASEPMIITSLHVDSRAG